MIVLAILAFAAAAYLGFNIVMSKRRGEIVHTELPALHYSAIQIICGNCAGEEEIPRKTFMDVHGACTGCGGKSYLLASHRGAYLRVMAQHGQSLAAIGAANEGFAEGRVVPFESRPKPVTVDRIAS